MRFRCTAPLTFWPTTKPNRFSGSGHGKALTTNCEFDQDDPRR